jgi:hypothetical protein
MKTLYAIRNSDQKEVMVHNCFGEYQEIFGDLYLSEDMEAYIAEELGEDAGYSLVVVDE